MISGVRAARRGCCCWPPRPLCRRGFAAAEEAEPPPIVVTGERLERAPVDQRRARCRADRRDRQRRQCRGRAALSAEPARAQAPYRRHPGAARHPHLGRRRQRAQPDLRRRRAALGADRQQQQQRLAALGDGLARRDRAGRRPLRPVRRRLSRQFDRRRRQSDDAPAGRPGGVAQPRHRASSISANTARRAISPAWQAEGSWGGRAGRFAWLVSANHVSSESQPLAYVTVAAPRRDERRPARR